MFYNNNNIINHYVCVSRLNTLSMASLVLYFSVRFNKIGQGACVRLQSCMKNIKVLYIETFWLTKGELLF